jgi:hypothetical protein
MKTLVGKLDKKDPLLIIKNDRCRENLEQRSNDTRQELLKPTGELFPNL